jgi:hypothetical protein
MCRFPSAFLGRRLRQKLNGSGHQWFNCFSLDDVPRFCREHSLLNFGYETQNENDFRSRRN